MTKLDASWSPTIRKIGDLERRDHSHLSETDQCYFFGAYTSQAGYSHSSTNSIISNIKKKPHSRGLEYKFKDMRRVAKAVQAAFKPESLPSLTFVPIPPSKIKTHPDYDCRMTAIAEMIVPKVDVREIVVSTNNREAAHAGNRLRPDELISMLRVDESVCRPDPEIIVLLDDVITTGCSFKACQKILVDRFPRAKVVGLFIARRVIKSPFDNLDS